MSPVQANGTTTCAPGTGMPRSLLAEVATELASVEEQLQTELRSKHPLVDKVVRHGYRLGGKRLRPALLLLAGKCCGKLTAHHTTLAMVVEMIHTATLVHDDVLDEADLRRHVDTVNARWGNETSVLLGDFLFSHAFYLASTLGTADACQVIGRATNRVCEGELRQTLSEGDLTLSEEDYYAIIDAKTAELCACCCELGARVSAADNATVTALANYGRALGMAFQIADDLLDVAGEEETTGKSMGRDLAKQKLTLPLIHARDARAEPTARQQFLTEIQHSTEGKRTAFLVTLQATDSLAYASRQAAFFAEKAATALAPLPPSTAKQTLLELAQFVVQRAC